MRNPTTWKEPGLKKNINFCHQRTAKDQLDFRREQDRDTHPVIHQRLGAVHAKQRNHTESMRQHLIWQHSGIVPDLHHIDRYRWNVGNHDPSQRIGKREIDILEYEIRVVSVELSHRDFGPRRRRVVPAIH